MEAGVSMFGTIILIFMIVFGMLDVSLNSSMKHEMYESVRSANQNALIEMEEDYKTGVTLTTPQMLETWLAEFSQTHDMSFDELKINFVQMETDPPLYLVYVEGYKGQYVMFSGDARAVYYNGSTIITK